MISKKFIFSLGCVIFLLLTIGAVSASTVDMAGVKFNIPEGYDEFEDASINGAVDEETQFITYCKLYWWIRRHDYNSCCLSTGG